MKGPTRRTHQYVCTTPDICGCSGNDDECCCMTVSREQPKTRCKNCNQPMVELAVDDHRTGFPLD